MGRTAKYSVEEIEAACQAMATAGRYSVGNVRQHLGGGGYAYLAPICQAWAERTATAAKQLLDVAVSAGEDNCSVLPVSESALSRIAIG